MTNGTNRFTVHKSQKSLAHKLTLTLTYFFQMLNGPR